MARRAWVVAVSISMVLLVVPPVSAQEQGTSLAFLIPNIFGQDGFIELEADEPFNHEAHFGRAREGQFSDVLRQGRLLNIAFVTQLTALPLPSSASGLTFGTDPETGLPTPRRQSFGPILTERAETIGQGRFNVSFSYQYFSFDEIDGIELDEGIPDSIAHCDCPAGIPLDFKEDVIELATSIDGDVSQFTAFFTYGLHDAFDVSVAVPIVRTSLGVTSIATIRRDEGVDPQIHQFEGGNPDQQVFTSSGDATGIGDVVVRLKGNPDIAERVELAAGVDTRLPSGDELDLLGTGAVGVRPFVVLSGSLGNAVSPHVNLAYQWNGESVLGGDLRVANDEQDLPDQLFYAVGVDWGVHERLTLAFDLLGQQLFDAQTLEVDNTIETPLGTQRSFPDLGFDETTLNQTSAAFGFKVNPGGNLLVDFNLLVKLNDGGLRDKVTPLVGFEYAFGSF